MTTGKNNLWNGWWRWPLIPVASIVGAFLGSAAFMLFQWFSMKMSGNYNESGRYFQYILPLFRDGIFGFLVVYFGCLVAPRGKLIVGVVLTTLLGALFVLIAVFSIKGMLGGTGSGLLSGIVIGFAAAGILFTIGKILHKLLFGMMYSLVMPKELKSALRNRRDL